MQIMKCGSQPSTQVPTANCTGAIRVDPQFQASAPARARGASVTFEPGARTAWHTHPLGQVLIVTSGAGWVQLRGSAKQAILPGDVVWIAPGEEHWHGAQATTAMTHGTVQELQDGKTVDRLEHVSDTDYGATA